MSLTRSLNFTVFSLMESGFDGSLLVLLSTLLIAFSLWGPVVAEQGVSSTDVVQQRGRSPIILVMG